MVQWQQQLGDLRGLAEQQRAHLCGVVVVQ